MGTHTHALSVFSFISYPLSQSDGVIHKMITTCNDIDLFVSIIFDIDPTGSLCNCLLEPLDMRQQRQQIVLFSSALLLRLTQSAFVVGENGLGRDTGRANEFKDFMASQNSQDEEALPSLDDFQTNDPVVTSTTATTTTAEKQVNIVRFRVL